VTHRPTYELDPLLLALVEKLPLADEVFTSGDQERWLAAMKVSLQLLYPPEWVPEARAKAKKAAAAHFPTIIAPEGGVTIAGPVSEPVLVVPGPPHPQATGGICVPTVPGDFPNLMEGIILNMNAAPPAEPDDYPVVNTDGTVTFAPYPEEAPSTTSADAVDDASGGGGPTHGGADPVSGTSSPLADRPGSPPTSSTTTGPVPANAKPERVKPGTTPNLGRRRDRNFTADQKGAIIRRAIREGMDAVTENGAVHAATVRKWMREMPQSVKAFTIEWEQEQERQALSEGTPTVEELEAERDSPIMAPTKEGAKPAVQWPTAPIERRPVDEVAVRNSQFNA
jgi:transposase-like protein